MDYRDQTERLRMTKSYLTEEYERMNMANVSMQSTSESLKKTSMKYDGRLSMLKVVGRVLGRDQEGVTSDQGPGEKVRQNTRQPIGTGWMSSS